MSPSSPQSLLQEISARLVERLDYIRLQPEKILEISALGGYGTELLKKRYTGSEIFQADKIPLPYAAKSMDLIISNLFLPRYENLAEIFAEMFRVLKPGGLLLFSTLGPDTLQELRQSWASVEDFPHVHIFLDMHDVGDILLQAHFADPVMDMEMLTLQYSNVQTMWRDLRAMRATNTYLSERRKTLTGKKRFAAFLTALTAAAKIALTAEVVYGHAWRMVREVGEVYVAVESIKRIK